MGIFAPSDEASPSNVNLVSTFPTIDTTKLSWTNCSHKRYVNNVKVSCLTTMINLQRWNQNMRNQDFHGNFRMATFPKD